MAMQPWTGVDREAFIKRAVEESVDLRGNKGNYWFNVMPKNTGIIEGDEDDKRAKVTEALANAIYNQHPKYKSISLKVYEMIMFKINTNPNLSRFDISNIMVVIKGSNAYAMLVATYRDPEVRKTFPWSDLDIMILINPNLPDDVFNRIKRVVHTLVVQTISQLKRTLDHMLFLDRPINDAFLSKDEIDEFKMAFDKELDMRSSDSEKFISPFTSDAIRNACSRNSFVIMDSEGHENSVVRVEVPHFDKCECIPLRKTPLFCSYNDTLNFNRVDEKNGQMAANFSLYRMRFNTIVVTADDESNDIKEERCAADFIDITIASKEDCELLDFWRHGRCMMIWHDYINTWTAIPDMHTCVYDLYKMLNVYQCPANKMEKRRHKYNVMQNLLGMMPPF